MNAEPLNPLREDMSTLPLSISLRLQSNLSPSLTCTGPDDRTAMLEPVVPVAATAGAPNATIDLMLLLPPLSQACGASMPSCGSPSQKAARTPSPVPHQDQHSLPTAEQSTPPTSPLIRICKSPPLTNVLSPPEERISPVMSISRVWHPTREAEVPAPFHGAFSAPPPFPDRIFLSTSSLATVLSLADAATLTYPHRPPHEPFRRHLTPPDCPSYTEGQRIRHALLAEARAQGNLSCMVASHPDLPPIFVPIQSGHGTSLAWPAVGMNPIEEADEGGAAAREGCGETVPWSRWFRDLRLWVMSVVWRLTKLVRPGRPVDARFGGVLEPELGEEAAQVPRRNSMRLDGRGVYDAWSVRSVPSAQVDAEARTEELNAAGAC